MRTQVSHFGLHTAGGLSFLLQGQDDVQTAEPWGHANPFEVAAKRCPHSIVLDQEPDEAEWGEFQTLASDPLVRELLPIPKYPSSPAYFGVAPEDEDVVVEWATELEQLASNDLNPGGREMWLVNTNTLSTELGLSNLGASMIFWVRPQNTSALLQLGAAGTRSKRKLVVFGSSAVAVPPMFRRLRTALANREVPDLNWRAIGARICREYMLGKNPYTAP